MMRFLYILCLVTVATFSVQNAAAQEYFVNFETSSGKFEACQNRTFMLIANVQLDSKNIEKIEWSSKLALEKVDNEMAFINTANAGPVAITFSAFIKGGVRLDSTVVVTVLPKPEVKLVFEDNRIELDNVSHIVEYKWIYNKQAYSDFVNGPFINPKNGVYKVYVRDTNGCSSTSEPVTINER